MKSEISKLFKFAMTLKNQTKDSVKKKGEVTTAPKDKKWEGLMGCLGNLQSLMDQHEVMTQEKG